MKARSQLSTVLMVGLLGAFGTTAAEPFTGFAIGNNLKQNLSERSGFLLGAAKGYILGVADALQLTPALCRPSGVTNGQLVVVVEKFLNDHPERLHQDQFILVASL
jgi:hypothetical protein